MSVSINNIFKSTPIWQQLLATLVFCTVIAALLYSLNENGTFIGQYILSLCIGLSVHSSCLIYYQIYNFKGWNLLVPVSIGAIFGVFIGYFLNGLYNGNSLEETTVIIVSNFKILTHSLGFAFLFSIIILYIMNNRERALLAEAELRKEQFDKLDIQKQIADTKLRLLQAQIEPHFLFNSLSNVVSLIDVDPDKSKFLLEKLSTFLRSTLSRSFNEQSNLRDEVTLISNYMDIFKIRMGNRLQYQIDIEDELLDYYLPPMILQPVIENAIKHGIEPLPEGGSITIKITKFLNKLRLLVIDTGKGFEGETSSGFGLLNVRQRLKSVYGDEAKLTISNNNPTGSQVAIEIPYV